MNRMINGKEVEIQAAAAAEIQAEWDANKATQVANKYKADRKAMHLPVEDQLDMMYWDAVNGTTIWLDYVANIKNTIPKPV